jgi:hypothetical protein
MSGLNCRAAPRRELATLFRFPQLCFTQTELRPARGASAEWIARLEPAHRQVQKTLNALTPEIRDH